MTEEEWQSEQNAWRNLWAYAATLTKAAAKTRLVATGACRQVAHLLPDPRLSRLLDLSEELVLAERASRSDRAWLRASADARAAVPKGGPSAVQMASQASVSLGRDDADLTEACQFVAFVFGFLAEGSDPKNSSLPHQVGSIISSKFTVGRDTNGNRLICNLIRDLYGNPFREVKYDKTWRTDTAVSLARTMYDLREFGAMPILADALQDVGCDNADVLDHCRDTALTHVRGCWVVDLVLGKS